MGQLTSARSIYSWSRQCKRFWLQDTLLHYEQWTSTTQIYMIYKLVVSIDFWRLETSVKYQLSPKWASYVLKIKISKPSAAPFPGNLPTAKRSPRRKRRTGFGPCRCGTRSPSRCRGRRRRRGRDFSAGARIQETVNLDQDLFRSISGNVRGRRQLPLVRTSSRSRNLW